MLALTRKKNEAIIVGDQIEIRILDIQGDKVRIGISAPEEVSIYREEIYKQVKQSNEGANTSDITVKESIFSLKNLVKQVKKERK